MDKSVIDKSMTDKKGSHRNREITLDPVPSHIVPPRGLKNVTKNQASAAESSIAGSKKKLKPKRYEALREEMLSLNNDPSRDVL